MPGSIPNMYINTKWNTKIEKVLLVIQKQCNNYKIQHNNISSASEKTHSALMITSIIITPLAGIVTSIGTMVTEEFEGLLYYTMTSTALSFLAGILVSISKFTKIEKTSQAHLTAMARYSSLEENIERQLFLDPKDRASAHEYLEWVIKNFDDLYTSSPMLLEDNLNKYTTFKDLYESMNNLEENRKINIKVDSVNTHNYDTCIEDNCLLCDPIRRINLKNIKKDKNDKPYLFTCHQDFKKYDDESMNLQIKNLSE